MDLHFIPSVESFPFPRAFMPFTLVIGAVFAVREDMGSVDVVD